MIQYQASPAPCPPLPDGCGAAPGQPCIIRPGHGIENVGRPRVTMHSKRRQSVVVSGVEHYNSVTVSAESHVRHDLIRETNRVSCDGCALDAKRPEGVPDLGRAWSSWR